MIFFASTPSARLLDNLLAQHVARREVADAKIVAYPRLPVCPCLSPDSSPRTRRRQHGQTGTGDKRDGMVGCERRTYLRLGPMRMLAELLCWRGL